MTRTLCILPILGLLSLTACNKSDPAAHDHDHAGHGDHAGDHDSKPAGKDTALRTVSVSVGDEGFKPSRVELKTGQKATLRFTRTSETTCATKVVFPELKIERELPLNQAVDVDVPTTEARQLTFQCGMGMYKSAVVVN